MAILHTHSNILDTKKSLCARNRHVRNSIQHLNRLFSEVKMQKNASINHLMKLPANPRPIKHPQVHGMHTILTILKIHSMPKFQRNPSCTKTLSRFESLPPELLSIVFSFLTDHHPRPSPTLGLRVPSFPRITEDELRPLSGNLPYLALGAVSRSLSYAIYSRLLRPSAGRNQSPGSDIILPQCLSHRCVAYARVVPSVLPKPTSTTIANMPSAISGLFERLRRLRQWLHAQHY